MTHTDVETLFHEFGHALHSIVTRAKYGRFAGAHVPGDFVEAPSQMLQNWVWDKKFSILLPRITAILPRKSRRSSFRK